LCAGKRGKEQACTRKNRRVKKRKEEKEKKNKENENWTTFQD
jgi:hypothetical protein